MDGRRPDATPDILGPTPGQTSEGLQARETSPRRPRAGRLGEVGIMAHALWNGSINFGLVSIPVKLFPAVRSSAGIHFHLVHDKYEGRIHNVRECEVCGQDVPWEHVDKGWEYQKCSYVVADDEEPKKMKPEAT